MSVKIIADSASEVSQETAKEWGITILPLKIRFGNEEFLDGVTLTNKRFYEMLIESDELPKTSQISPADYEEAFKKAFEEGLAAFTSLGYKRSKGTGDKNVGFGYVKKEGFITERAANYATTNIKEMFAECYQYLMTGTCLSADMLEDFFPECLSIADEMLEVIRNLPDEKRHKRS